MYVHVKAYGANAYLVGRWKVSVCVLRAHVSSVSFIQFTFMFTCLLGSTWLTHRYVLPFANTKSANTSSTAELDLYLLRKTEKWGVSVLTSMRRISIDSTVVKKNICRKKSDTSPTTANRQNSWETHKPAARSEHKSYVINRWGTFNSKKFILR